VARSGVGRKFELVAGWSGQGRGSVTLLPLDMGGGSGIRQRRDQPREVKSNGPKNEP